MAGFDFKKFTAQEDALEKLIAKTSDPKKKAELVAKEKKIEAMIRRAGKGSQFTKATKK